MELLVVNQQLATKLLPMDECIKVMEQVLTDLSRGLCELPLRSILWLPKKVGALGIMPSYWEPAGTIGLKAVSYFPCNEGTELDTHQGAVLLYEAQRGRLFAIVDATSITAIRTAAVSAVATKHLARKNATTLAIIGAGVQAATHLQAMLIARPIKHVRVCSKTLRGANRFAKDQMERHQIPVTAVSNVQEAVDGADIVCTTSSSAEPVLLGKWISPGTHVNAVGSSVSFTRELDGHAVARSRLFVDRKESVLCEAGDFILAKNEGLVNDSHILAEIGDLLTGGKIGRSSKDDITLFKSVGLAIEDLAAALHVYRKAKNNDHATHLLLGGHRVGAH